MEFGENRYFLYDIFDLIFRIFDIDNPARLNAESAPIPGTATKSFISVEFAVTRATEALAIQLERRPSQNFDNRISGTLHVYQVWLVRLPLDLVPTSVVDGQELASLAISTRLLYSGDSTLRISATCPRKIGA